MYTWLYSLAREEKQSLLHSVDLFIEILFNIYLQSFGNGRLCMTMLAMLQTVLPILSFLWPYNSCVGSKRNLPQIVVTNFLQGSFLLSQRRLTEKIVKRSEIITMNLSRRMTQKYRNYPKRGLRGLRFLAVLTNQYYLSVVSE